MGLALLLVGLLGHGVAFGFPKLPKSPPQHGLPGEQLLPPDRLLDTPPRSMDANEAARKAQLLNGGGRVLSVEETRSGWRVKLLKDGNVRIVSLPD